MRDFEEDKFDMNNQGSVRFPDIEDAVIQQAIALVQDARLSEVDIAAYRSNPDDLAKTVALALLEPLRRLLHIVQRWRDDAFVVPYEELRFDLSRLEGALWEMQELMSAPFSWLSEHEVEAPVFMDMYRETRMHVTMVLCYVRLIDRKMDMGPDSYIERYLGLLTDRSFGLASYLIRVAETAPVLDWIIPPYFIR